MATSDRFDIQGHVRPGFDAVREAFAENFVRRAALLALKYLLSAATECSHQDMVEAQHDSSSSGDADAQSVSAQAPSRRVVFSSSETPRVTHRRATEDGPTLSQDVERTLVPPLGGHDTGGGR